MLHMRLRNVTPTCASELAGKDSGCAAVSRAGNVPPDVAERLANVWLSWNFQANWTASTGLRYVGKRYADKANTLTMPAYTTTDLALQWNASRDTTLTLRGLTRSI